MGLQTSSISSQVYDLAIIGGGINGLGIARDAAGQGLSVLLCEKDDFGSGTSSASTKLIHGGLRYLEHYEFRLVREALIEREVLLRTAPHIIWPLRFVLPHHNELRPAWVIRLGLFLYDHLGGRKLLPASQQIDLRKHPAGQALKNNFKRAFVYSDCWVQDARLVVLNAVDAARYGATVLSRTECLQAQRVAQLWQLKIRQKPDQSEYQVRARALVNAAGPWAGDVLQSRVDSPARAPLRLVKGSHLVVPKLFEHDHAYIFQHSDQRIVFAIPYEQEFTLLGTTDQEYSGSPDTVNITESEAEYLCNAVNRYFKSQISPADSVWSFAGVRPLYNDDQQANASEVTRDYVLDLPTTAPNQAPLLNVFGGKLTTYRKLSEQAVNMLGQRLGYSTKPWTAHRALPGGDIPDANFEQFLSSVKHKHPWLPAAQAWRLARNYGTQTQQMLENIESINDLGQDFGHGFTEIEASYLMREEWAQTADDMLWRRSKMGLHGGPHIKAKLDRWLEQCAKS